MRKIYNNFILIIAAVLITILICELIFKFYLNGIYRVDPVLERNKINALNYKGNQNTEFVSFEWNIKIKINELGFRDSNEIYESNKKKILILGDSFIEGYGVSLENTIPKKLEKILKNNKHDYRVLNGGIIGNDLLDYINIYNNYFSKDDSIKYVITSLYIENDLLNEVHDRMAVSSKNKTPFAGKIKIFMAKHSAFYNLLVKSIKISKFNNIFVKFNSAEEVNNANNYKVNINSYDKKYIFSSKLLKDFDNQLKKNNKKHIIMLTPSKEQIVNESWQNMLKRYNLDEALFDKTLPFKKIVKQLELESLEYLNLLKYLNIKKNNSDKSFYFEIDRHTNQYGNEAIAEYLFKNLQQKGL